LVAVVGRCRVVVTWPAIAQMARCVPVIGHDTHRLDRQAAWPRQQINLERARHLRLAARVRCRRCRDVQAREPIRLPPISIISARRQSPRPAWCPDRIRARLAPLAGLAFHGRPILICNANSFAFSRVSIVHRFWQASRRGLVVGGSGLQTGSHISHRVPRKAGPTLNQNQNVPEGFNERRPCIFRSPLRWLLARPRKSTSLIPTPRPSTVRLRVEPTNPDRAPVFQNRNQVGGLPTDYARQGTPTTAPPLEKAQIRAWSKGFGKTGLHSQSSGMAGLTASLFLDLCAQRRPTFVSEPASCSVRQHHSLYGHDLGDPRHPCRKVDQGTPTGSVACRRACPSQAEHEPSSGWSARRNREKHSGHTVSRPGGVCAFVCREARRAGMVRRNKMHFASCLFLFLPRPSGGRPSFVQTCLVLATKRFIFHGARLNLSPRLRGHRLPAFSDFVSKLSEQNNLRANLNGEPKAGGLQQVRKTGPARTWAARLSFRTRRTDFSARRKKKTLAFAPSRATAPPRFPPTLASQHHLHTAGPRSQRCTNPNVF